MFSTFFIQHRACLKVIAALWFLPWTATAGSSLPVPEVSDLHLLRDYRVGKTSFVIGLESRSERPPMLKVGERHCLLHVQGIGSLRHIWETHRGKPAPFLLEFFVDGESSPSLRGNLADLINAAQKANQRLVSNPGSIVSNQSHNLYLPVPFDRSLRVDLVAIAPIDLVFLQLDYRVEDTALAGVRLAQAGEGSNLSLAYSGLPQKITTSAPQTRTHRFAIADGRPALLRGPGIIRSLRLSGYNAETRLRIMFEHKTSPAVDVLASDFFGPFRGMAVRSNLCSLPMPFRRAAKIEVSGLPANADGSLELEVEKVTALPANAAWFHAKSTESQKTSGVDPFQVLYTRGRGHWLGMALYNTGHDHGGGDFVVVDGESSAPAFLHGINGEDYFSFAWFGRGDNSPYSEAFDNVSGRIRLHLENPYAFRKSVHVGWGVLKHQDPRGVAYWYEASPVDNALPVPEVKGITWEVFGPLEAPIKSDGFSVDNSSVETLFGPLPTEAALDSGKGLAINHLYRGRHSGVFNGWATQHAVGPHLNLTYIYGHVSDLGSHHHLGYYGRLMMARTRLHSAPKQNVSLLLSYDDPVEVLLNGKRLFEDLNAREGFTTKIIPAVIAPGQNSLVIRSADTPNNNTCWAGFSLMVLDKQGRDITGSLTRPTISRR